MSAKPKDPLPVFGKRQIRYPIQLLKLHDAVSGRPGSTNEQVEIKTAPPEAAEYTGEPAGG
jgi:hypothetical protein